MSYKCIFVDWYKTLSVSVFWEQFKEADHPCHAFYKPISHFLFVESPVLLRNWMRGDLASEKVVDRLCHALHLEPEILLRELILSCQHMQLISENSLNLITALRLKGIKVLIATDNMDTFHRWTVPSLRLDTYFDHILSSFELHALKADIDGQGKSLFFSSYLKSNAINPGESLLLDDSNETFGHIIRQSGIDYQCLKPGGLDAVLQIILENI
jgi:FMN phosphatase YigB (HAD superfamily)